MQTLVTWRSLLSESITSASHLCPGSSTQWVSSNAIFFSKCQVLVTWPNSPSFQFLTFVPFGSFGTLSGGQEKLVKIFTAKSLQNGKLLAVSKRPSQHQGDRHTGMWPEQGVSGGTWSGSISVQDPSQAEGLQQHGHIGEILSSLVSRKGRSL